MPRIITQGADMGLEEIAWKYRRGLYPGDPDKAARLAGFVERIYALNPGLSLLGARIPPGTEIMMPDDAPDDVAPANRLWG